MLRYVDKKGLFCVRNNKQFNMVGRYGWRGIGVVGEIEKQIGVNIMISRNGLSMREV